MITALEAGQVSLKSRMSLEAHISKVADKAIRDAAERGEQSCTFQIEKFGMAELTTKRIEGILTKSGYKASHRVGRDSITVVVSWVPCIEDFPLLNLLAKGK